MPDSVQQPELTLQLRSGTSLDMALLLCSLLLGQGADAAVVLGYAPAGIVENVQRGFKCTAPAIGQRLEVQRMATEFLASCGSHVAAESAGQQRADGSVQDLPPAEQVHMIAQTPDDQQPSAETGYTTSTAAEAAAAASDVAASAIVGSMQADTMPPPAADNDTAQLQGGHDQHDSTAQSTDVTLEQQTNHDASQPATSPYRLHAWVLVGRKVSRKHVNCQMHCVHQSDSSCSHTDTLSIRCAGVRRPSVWQHLARWQLPCLGHRVLLQHQQPLGTV